MVEIVKKGKRQYYVIECPECKSLLKFTRADESYYTDTPTQEHFIKCPECWIQIVTRNITKGGTVIQDFSLPYDE